MAEEEKMLPLPEEDDTNFCLSKNAYIPEEPTPDASISLLDIQMPETPESNKGQISDGDTSRLESPKMVKPVLGKVQAKKRLMAFANQFKVLPKSQVKSNLSQSQHSVKALKTKDKMVQDDTSTNKSRKKTEEKILAIEEIRREESKSKMLLAEAMAAASMEEDHINHINKNTSGLLESTRHLKEKSRHKRINDSRKNRSMDRKYSERYRHPDKTDRDYSNREVKERNGSTESSIRKSSQDRDKRKKDKKRKDHRDRRDNSKTDTNRDKKEEGKDSENEKEKREETRERREETKDKKENVKDRQNDTLGIETEGKDKIEKDTDKWKEKELSRCNSWMELRKSGLTLDDIIHFRRCDNTERSVRNRTAQDYVRYFEQMLMLNNYRLKRQSLIVEGLDGPRKYPPESVKTTNRAKGPQLLYCENPRMSLLLNIPQLLQAVTPERREKIRDICEASSPRFDIEDKEDIVPQKRNWYQQIKATNNPKDIKWQMTVQLPRSKWDSEDEETSSTSVAKKKIEKPVNKLHVSVNKQERCSTSSSITDEDKIDNNIEDIEKNKETGGETVYNITTNDEASTSSLLQSAGSEKLVSEYEQFMKMVCTATDVSKEHSPKRNSVKSASPRSYHEFNIESNLEDNTNIEMPLKEKFERKEKLQIIGESIKSTECEESTPSTDCQIQIDENNMQIENANNNDESADSKSVPSDWENVRIKVEHLSDENTESRETKKKKKQNKIMSSNDSSSSNISFDSDKEKKKKECKRKVLNNSSSSDPDSTDSSSSSSSDSNSSGKRRKRKRKKKKVGKKRKRTRRIARTKKKHKRKMIIDSSSSDSDELVKKKKRIKKKTKEVKQHDAKSINNEEITKIISKSPVITSHRANTLHSVTPVKKIKEEAVIIKDKKRANQIMLTRKNTTDTIVHDNECMKHREETKESKSDENFMEQWEVDSMIAVQQNVGNISTQDHTEELEKIDISEKDKYRRKRKHSRDNEQDNNRASKVNEEMIHEKKERSDEEREAKRKKRKEKDIRSGTEFLTDWERKSEHITQQLIQNEAKFSKKIGKQKKEKWGETDFNTLNVPSLTQLEKEVCQKQLLADEWEVDSLEALSDLTANKRTSNQSTSKKVEKEVRYDKKTDTYIAIEKESAKEMKKRQERLCAIRIWEEEQEEGEREEMILLEQKNKRKRNDWDIEEESFLRKSNEEQEIHQINDIIGIEKEWSKTDESTSVGESSNKLMMKLEPTGSKRVKKSRWDMGSQSEEKSEVRDIWEEEYTEWSKIDKCKQKLEKANREESCTADYSENSVKSDLIDFYHRIPQSRESLERPWTLEEKANRFVQAKKIEDTSVNILTPTKINEEQIAPNKKGHQTKDQFKEILVLNAKFKEKAVELYSPSSPALSQKSQDIEATSDSSSFNSLPRSKRRMETLITVEELSIPMTSIPLQLTKLHDNKHVANEEIEDILDKAQVEEKDSTQEFNIKKANLFDDLPINELCLETDSTKLVRMDIFAEYESEELHSKQRATSSNVSLAMHTKDDEINEGKTALKLIPKQLLIRRTNEQAKLKRILETPLRDPAQHAAALLTIQKKLLESHALKDDIKESPDKESIHQFKPINLRYSAANSNETNKLLDTTEFAVAPKSSIIATVIRRSRSPVSEKVVSIRPEQSKNYDRENKNDDVKKCKTSRDLSDSNISSDVRSSRDQRKRSPSKKESEKRYLHEYNKDKKERKCDDTEKSDKKDNRSSKANAADSRRKSSPSARAKKRRNGSPYASWERQRSRSPGHSWSRSHSRSPKRKEEITVNTRDRERKRERYDDERSCRSKTNERREKYARSPSRFDYNEDSFKKHGFVSSNGNHDDWDRRRRDNMDKDREKDIRSYDPMEMLRERTIESEKYRDTRFHIEETDRTFWQYENSNTLRDGNEFVDSYANVRDLPLEYDDRLYYKEGSLERDILQPLSKYKRSHSKSSTGRERQWGKDKDPLGSDHHGHLMHRLRSRTPPRSRYSPMRQSSEWFRRKSRSHSRSWSRSRSRTRSRSRSGSRSRSTSRSRPRIRSRSRSRSRSLSDSRSRVRSASMSKIRSPDGLRMSELRSSRSPSLGRSRLNEVGRERKDEDENRKFNICGERGRRIETIIQSGVTLATSILDSEMGINSCTDTAIANFQYSNEIESGNEYYYTENNLTYPPCIDESTTNSPKRLSLDDRLELELGIKKQRNKDSIGVSSEYSSNFNSNVIVYPSSSQQQQQQMIYRQQPTVLQVGNVLQVVPADFNGVQSARREVSAATTPPMRPGSSQVVRVGNVLQVVPTSLDWSSGQSSSTADQSNGVLYSSAVPALSPSASSAPVSIPVPVPVPLPVPAVPTAANTLGSVATISPAAPLPLPVPVPMPVPIPSTTTTSFPRNEAQPQKIAQPVYNYEAILETRRKEREERKQLRDLRRKEKERRRIERINRRALRLLEKNNVSQQAGSVLLDCRKGLVVDPLVLKALKEGEEQIEIESPANPVKEEEIIPVKEEDEDAAVDEDEDDDEDEVEAEAEDDEEEEEVEDEDEDDDDDEEKLSQMINQRTETNELTIIPSDANKDQAEIETKKEWPELPLPPLKSILIAPGFRRDAISNDNFDDLLDADDDTKGGSDKDEETDKNNEYDKDTGPDIKLGKSKLEKLLKKSKRSKKSVQFADGIKPGEGTSPSGGEGDMPSPPPPKGIGFREEFKDLRREKMYSFRKSRKLEKRGKPPKAKKKVKVKIIKLKKPRVTPLTAMIMDDSDELDDRSPPPPPPGSPPPPHLWPSYLSIYNTTFRAIEQSQTMTLTPVQAPPPTPLPLLVPPPPLNYTIQPCSKS